MMVELSLNHDLRILSGKDGRQNWYQAERPVKRPNVTLDLHEIRLLVMCKELVWHLLPQGLREEVDQAVNKTTVLLPDMAECSNALDSICEVSVKGSIDYTPYQAAIEDLFKAIREKRICSFTYHSPHWPDPKVYLFAPVKVLSFRDALYVEGFKVDDSLSPKIVREATFSIHRINKLVIMNRPFNFDSVIDNYQDRPNLFGFMAHNPFKVKVKFKGSCETYIRERVWSENQKVIQLKGGGVELEFTAQSEREVISWVLSFGTQAVLTQPKKLREQIKVQIESLNGLYA